MNSKLSLYFFLFFALVLTSCGLKKYPKAPSGTNLPEVVDRYKYDSAKALDEEKKKKEKKEEDKKESQQKSE